jgi:hypothetical protein
MENPRRKTTVSTEAIGDGLGVFDPAQNKSYLLNATSALIWQHCDGNTSPQELAALLVRKFNVTGPQAEQLAQAALDELANFDLFEAGVQRPLAVPQAGLTRRQVLARFAVAGISAALLPLVSPVVAKAQGANNLIPLLNCVDDNGDGTFTAHFGYLNQTSSAITVPLGPKNMFVPPPNDRAQPTVFQPGENDNVFQVVFDGTYGQEIKWLLKADGDSRHQVEASATSEPCPTPTTTPSPTTTQSTTQD